MTVSRVINAEANVRAATRARVEAAVSALKYAPNQAARSLAGAAQLRIGLLHANPSAGFLGEFLIGSLDEATRRNIQLVFEQADPAGEGLETASRLIADGIDGVLLPPPLCESPAVLGLFAAADIPAALLATTHRPADQLAVAVDERQAARAMTNHLLSLGHRRIGFITGDPALIAARQRLDGYRDALADGALGTEDDLVVDGCYTYRSGLDAAERLLGLETPPTAIFAANDDMAAAAVAAAHRLGLDVPRNLSVVGFDDTTLATAIWPELTTIRQPIADMARAAVDMLVGEIRGQRETGDDRLRLLAFTLIRRASDAPPQLDSAAITDSATT